MFEGLPQRENSLERKAKLRGPVSWLAMGVLVAESAPPFRRTTPGLLSPVTWRYISTSEAHRSDPRYVLVPCVDAFVTDTSKATKTAMGFQFSCFCKTVHWFRRALSLFPQTRFLGKMEDDSVLYDARVVAELAAAYRAARVEQATRRPSLWYGHFDWAVHIPSTLRGIYCAAGDNAMLARAPPCNKGRGVLAPFANGGLDIRSRAMAEHAAGCEQVWQYVAGFDPTNQSYLGSCDGLQGYFLARCPAPVQHVEAGSEAAAGDGPGAVPLGTALHLPWPKFHPPGRAAGVRTHSSLIHPDKRCLHGGAWYRSATKAAADCDPAVPGWKWHEGQALLPFAFSLAVERRPLDASQVLTWSAWNLSSVQRYHQLHAKREDSRYCDELPCGGIAAVQLQAARTRARPRAAVGRGRADLERPV
uniref:Uncharacterized protein n=1 Tax=Haptolina ericina TaxID=156174 RepID=A0A7S3BLE2_9EUKA|mmetsp:Transcript_63002/g.140297  ORF Transcript_63002/g.140297 Transcript_63002/m.140297 type:complete len:418 (+) Transcript_63002:66-1319(+)